MYITYVTYNVYIYIYIYLCIAYISSHSKGPEQDQLRSPFVPYVRNTAERSIHIFDSGPYIYTVYMYTHTRKTHVYPLLMVSFPIIDHFCRFQSQAYGKPALLWLLRDFEECELFQQWLLQQWLNVYTLW